MSNNKKRGRESSSPPSPSQERVQFHNVFGGFDESQPKKKSKVEEKEKNGSHSDAPDSGVTGLATPDQKYSYDPSSDDYLPRSSSSSVSVSNKHSLLDAGKKVIPLNLEHTFNGEGAIDVIFVMKPEVRTTLKHLQDMSKKNPELQVGLEVFRSAVNFLNTILLVKGQTKDVKPSSSP